MSIFKSLNAFESALTMEQMLKEGGLDYEVAKIPLQGISDKPIPSENHSMVIRTDKKWELGIVRNSYGLVQPRELADLCEVWNSEGDASYLAAGAPGRGERLFIVMKAPDFIDLGKNDRIINTFFVTSAHDGQGSIVGYPAPYHTRTDSVLMPAGLRMGAIRVKHSKHVKKRLDSARHIMSNVRKFWTDFTESFDMMKICKISDDQARTYLKACLMRETDSKAILSTRATNIMEDMFALYKAGPSSKMPYAKGTMLGAYLAVCHYADHHKVIRISKKRDIETARINALLLGDGARQKAESLGFAITLTQRLGHLRKNNALS